MARQHWKKTAEWVHTGIAAVLREDGTKEIVAYGDFDIREDPRLTEVFGDKIIRRFNPLHDHNLVCATPGCYAEMRLQKEVFGNGHTYRNRAGFVTMPGGVHVEGDLFAKPKSGSKTVTLKQAVEAGLPVLISLNEDLGMYAKRPTSIRGGDFVTEYEAWAEDRRLAHEKAGKDGPAHKSVAAHSLEDVYRLYADIRRYGGEDAVKRTSAVHMGMILDTDHFLKKTPADPTRDQELYDILRRILNTSADNSDRIDINLAPRVVEHSLVRHWNPNFYDRGTRSLLLPLQEMRSGSHVYFVQQRLRFWSMQNWDHARSMEVIKKLYKDLQKQGGRFATLATPRMDHEDAEYAREAMRGLTPQGRNPIVYLDLVIADPARQIMVLPALDTPKLNNNFVSGLPGRDDQEKPKPRMTKLPLRPRDKQMTFPFNS